MTERITPIAAVLSAFAALACCLPLGFAGALGVFTLSTMFQENGGWFLAVAAVLLVTAIVQMVRKQRRCQTKVSKFSLAVLAMSAAVVVGVLLFPQIVASLLADYVL